MPKDRGSKSPIRTLYKSPYILFELLPFKSKKTETGETVTIRIKYKWNFQQRAKK